MNRRHFLKTGSLAGLSVPALALAGCRPTANKLPDDPGRQANGAAENPESEGAGGALPGEFALSEATIDELQQKMQQGSYTSRSITEAYLRRINEIDKKGPSLNTVIELNPDALAIADGEDRPGVPIFLTGTHPDRAPVRVPPPPPTFVRLP